MLFVSFLKGQAQDADISPLPRIDKEFQVVAHIVLDSLGQEGVSSADIIDGINAANAFFEPIGVSFQVCRFNTIENWQYTYYDKDAEREIFTLHNDPERINVYYVDSLKEACGVATLGGVSSESSNGVVIGKTDCNNAGTIAHEFGHYFGLNHTFSPDEFKSSELVDGSNCDSAGDQVCDTPADPYIVGEPDSLYHKDCVFIYEEKDDNGDYYTPHIGNVMSYYSGCSCGFTDGQYRRMVETYNSRKFRW